MAPLGDMPGNVTKEAMNIRRLRIELAAITRTAPVTGVSQVPARTAASAARRCCSASPAAACPSPGP
jgi:hypothetical protein